MLDAARLSMLVFAVVIAVGGVFGFVKAQSKPSLIAGLVSGALLVGAYIVSGSNMQAGLIAGTLICSLLGVVFGMRLMKTRKAMPSGVLLALCVLEMAFLGIATAGPH